MTQKTNYEPEIARLKAEKNAILLAHSGFSILQYVVNYERIGAGEG